MKAKLLLAMALIGGSLNSAFAQNVILSNSLTVEKRVSFSTARAEIYYDQSVFKRFRELILAAKSSIDFDLYLFGGKDFNSLIPLLQKKVQSGVRVRALYDARRGIVPIYTIPMSQTIAGLKRAGVLIYSHSQKPFGTDGRGAKRTQAAIDHNKFLIIDRQVALLGSTNFTYSQRNFHDVMVEVEGEVIQDLQWMFDFNFSQATQNNLNLKCPQFQYAPAPKGRYSVGEPVSFVRLLTTNACKSDIRVALLKQIQNAQRSIDISMHQMDPLRDVLEALTAAKNRGVKVRILLDPTANFRYSVPFVGNYLPKNLLNSKAISELQKRGFELKIYNANKVVEVAHLKQAIFDDHSMIVGSANWTEGGFRYVIESNLELVGGRAVADAHLVFEKDWQNGLTHAEATNAFGKVLLWLYEKWENF